MLKCNYCDHKEKDHHVKALIAHLEAEHDVAPPYRLADHSKCTTKPKAPRRLPRKPAGFKPFG